MNREIKFRVWDTENQEFFYPDELRIQYNQIGWTADHYLDIDSYGTKPEEYVLQQFTGLFDKNGTPIYEGDIVKFKEWKPKEIFYECAENKKGFAGFRLKNTDMFLMGWDTEFMIIVGNAFENPELLQA